MTLTFEYVDGHEETFKNIVKIQANGVPFTGNDILKNLFVICSGRISIYFDGGENFSLRDGSKIKNIHLA